MHTNQQALLKLAQDFMSALIADRRNGAVTPQASDTAYATFGKLVKVIKYGFPDSRKKGRNVGRPKLEKTPEERAELFTQYKKKLQKAAKQLPVESESAKLAAALIAALE